MPIFLVKAVHRSADGKNSAHVADKWPVDVAGLAEAKAFADATPTKVWNDADTFEIVDETGRTLSCRPLKEREAWTDEPPAETED